MGGVLSFLKKAGEIILQGAAIFTGISPLIQNVIPKAGGVLQVVSKDLGQISDAIIQAEAFGQALGLPGAQKLQAAVGPVSQIIMDSALLAGKPVADPALFKQGATKIADGMADILNSIHADAAQAIKPQDVKIAA